ncbi:MAG: putative quinol monooxygenase [Candidatus Competibacter sp.]
MILYHHLKCNTQHQPHYYTSNQPNKTALKFSPASAAANFKGKTIMTDPSIHIVARIVAKPDTVTQLQAVLTTLLEPTRQEAGCRRYTLLQNQQDPTDFTFVEEWASETALNAHPQTAHFQAAFRQISELLGAEPDIRRYKRVG